MRRDSLETLSPVDPPVSPRPEFGVALLERLVAELEAPVRPTPWRERLRPALRPGRRRLVAAVAAATAVIVAVVAVVSSLRPTTAYAVIDEAIRNFASVPNFRAEIHYDLNPEGARSANYPEGGTADVGFLYAGDEGARLEVLGTRPDVLGTRPDFNAIEPGPAGSFFAWDGKDTLAHYDAASNEFVRRGISFDLGPVQEMTWNAPVPNWADICRRTGSEVFPDETVAGRETRHVRCGDYSGAKSWDLWVDAETGLILKLRGELGVDDFGFHLGTSPAGGFTVTRITYDPEYSRDELAAKAPSGAIDVTPRPADLPSFRAVYRSRWLGDDQDPAFTRLVRLSYRDWTHWRVEWLEDTRGEVAGQFLVRDGGEVSSYRPKANEYTSDRASELEVPEGLASIWPGVWASHVRPSRCELVGEDIVLGRPVDHRRCPTEPFPYADLWLDRQTGLLLKGAGSQSVLEVESLELEPDFPAGTFAFVPPTGARDARVPQRKTAWQQTTLRRGETAPTWSGPLLDGGSFDLAAQRGKPVLVLFMSDINCGTDPVCESLPSFEDARRAHRDDVTFVWVDLFASDGAKQLVDRMGLTYPAVRDPPGDIARRWGLEGYPFYVLLDSDGRAVDVRIQPQSRAQLDAMLSEAGMT